MQTFENVTLTTISNNENINEKLNELLINKGNQDLYNRLCKPTCTRYAIQ